METFTDKQALCDSAVYYIKQTKTYYFVLHVLPVLKLPLLHLQLSALLPDLRCVTFILLTWQWRFKIEGEKKLQLWQSWKYLLFMDSDTLQWVTVQNLVFSCLHMLSCNFFRLTADLAQRTLHPDWQRKKYIIVTPEQTGF